MNSIHAAVARTGLVRPTHDRVIGGVCAAVAQRYGLDAWAVRALFVLVLMALPGSQLLVYPVAWVLMPAEGFVPRAETTPGAPTPQDTVIR